MKKIPVTILAGFLGAGKTTLLNRILSAEHGLRIAVLVNDFGEINIDSQLITSTEGETISLANGCVCCTIRDDLVSAVVELLDGVEPPEYIVTEASGVSDPAEVAMGFALSSKLALRVRVDAILTVVDAEHIRVLDDSSEQLAVDQIAAADIVIVNKIDRVDENSLETLHEWIRECAPRVRICDACYADLPLDVLFDVGSQSTDSIPNPIRAYEHRHHDHAESFVTWSWTSDRALDFQPVYEAFQTLPSSVFRAKGILNLREVADKRAIVQMVGKRVTIAKGEPWGKTRPSSQIVAIAVAGGLDPAALDARFSTCIAGPDSAEPNPLADAVVEILRR